jgi:glucose-6-phosphate 1-dehydrogenase
VRLFIHNDRWAGVPIVLRAGKALDKREVVVRLQLHGAMVPLFGGAEASREQQRNEFVMRLQPGEALWHCPWGTWSCQQALVASFGTHKAAVDYPG